MIATRLKRKQPILTSIHCMAHRLALAASQSGGKMEVHERYIQAHIAVTFMTIAQLRLVA